MWATTRHLWGVGWIAKKYTLAERDGYFHDAGAPVCWSREKKCSALMPRKIRQLKADLRRVGSVQVAQEGSHTKWKHALVPDKEVVLAGHDGDDARFYQEKAVRELLDLIARARQGGHT